MTILGYLRRRLSTRVGQVSLLLLLLGLSLALSAMRWGDWQAQGRAARADEAFGEERWELAEREYDAAAQAAPGSAALAFNQANTAYRRGEIERARAGYREALSLDDGALTADIWFNLGNLAFNGDELEAAIEAYRSVLRAQPAAADARANLELALRRLREAESQDSESQDGEEQESSEEQQDQEQDGESSQNQDQQQDGQEQRDQQSEDSSQEASQGEGSPTPQPGSEAAGTATASAEAAQTQAASGSATPSAGQAGGSPNGTPMPMSREEAERLLMELGRRARTLQEQMGQIFVVPGPTPSQRW